ncbi:hypothetical protein HS088_TW08G00314 [Tripterygium wilfordii]|uniref:Uncharacterized protein n=1 Tax=Tripterygium wilfordii TaxID=458696 RepID=A0A7J7DBK2_TRIWF|nr:hypothetical protein HS088_TW08G00314 [Tripterygium wilfordii]
MSRAPVYYENRHRHGWDTTSDDYLAHISRIERMPSVITDVPQYPNVHKVFNNKLTYEEEPPRKEHSPKDHKKKVQVIETIEEVSNPKGQDHEEIFMEETVNSGADGYIQQKHKGFELCKWKTFKLH